jgi:YHS domain-containing protein
MNFLARVVRFVVGVVILSWGLRVLSRFFSWVMKTSGVPGGEPNYSQPDGAQQQLVARQLMRDPVCGMHVPENLAIPYRDNGELKYFCSTECRDKYASGNLRRAASG